jgi:type IV pilus assembly protein PilZ
MREKRQHPRKVVQVGVAYQVGDGPRVDATCCDISLGGMFIETPTPAKFNEDVLVFLRLPELKDEAKVKSKVRWTEPTGMGVQFGMMGARETHALMKLVASTKG